MKKVFIILVLSLAAASLPIKAPNCTQYGTCVSYDWKSTESAHLNDAVPLMFAVKQKNIEELRRYVDIISTPGKYYGNYISYSELVKATTDNTATKRVHSWLTEQGFNDIVYHDGGFFTCYHSVMMIESLFNAKMGQYSSQKSSSRILRTLQHEVPYEISDSVDFVSGLSDFPALRHHSFLTPLDENYAEQPNSTTPSKLINAYRVSQMNPEEMKNATQAVFEALGQSYSPDDLFAFQSWAKLPQMDVANIIGPNIPNNCINNPGSCAEANLDVQYLMAISPYSPTTYWSVAGSGYDIFLKWIVDVASKSDPPLVHSVSYGGPEIAFPENIVRRVDDEFMKLGARGVSIIVATGDDGVAGFEARQNPKACGFVPSYPASLPHVVSIGATMGIETDTKEIACTSEKGGLITTGGGFSNLFDAPSFQKRKTIAYLQSSNDVPDTSLFNSFGRAYPDVSLAGHNYLVSIGGKFYQISGTSASAPVFAGMLSLINGKRMQKGKPPVGWATPAIWHIIESNPEAFNDITDGRNNCCAGSGNVVCCPFGFKAAPGWDPVCGFGSINFEILQKAWLEL